MAATIRTVWLMAILVCLTVFTPLKGQAHTIDDVSGLNETTVSDIIAPTTTIDIQNAVKKAIQQGKHIAIAGRKHSQGGHIMAQDAIVLDMLSYNKILGLDNKTRILTVQSGATWAQIQDYLNERGFAIKVQQSSNIFTVGGSMSVNAHGRDPRFGSLIDTIKAFKLVRADGNVVSISRKENPELFPLVIGGYGLFGIITDVEIEIVPNSMLRKTTLTMNCDDYPAYLSNNIIGKDDFELHYARPNITLTKLLQECVVSTYARIADAPSELTPLEEEERVKTSQWLMDISRKSNLGKTARWFIQESLIDAPGKIEVISRNNAMRPPIEFLEYQSPKDTDVLQEYFIPIESANAFMLQLKDIILSENVNILSITLRYQKADKEAFLSYAAKPSIAFVLYINHGKDAKAIAKIQSTTKSLIDAALANKGSYYLPYASYGTQEQLEKAYPQWKHFVQMKHKYDPSDVFMNTFFEKYGR